MVADVTSKDSLPCFRKRGSTKCRSCMSGYCSYTKTTSSDSPKREVLQALGSLETLKAFLTDPRAQDILEKNLAVLREHLE